jgi:hypothetical protein
VGWAGSIMSICSAILPCGKRCTVSSKGFLNAALDPGAVTAAREAEDNGAGRGREQPGEQALAEKLNRSDCPAGGSRRTCAPPGALLRSAGTGLAAAGEDQRSMPRRLACARGDMGHRRGACLSVSVMHWLRQAGAVPDGGLGGAVRSAGQGHPVRAPGGAGLRPASLAAWPGPVPGSRRALLLLASAMLLAMTTWFSATAVLPQLRTAWALTTVQASFLTVAVQVGFVVGAMVSAFFNLADTIAAVFWGFWVVADSAQFSSIVTETGEQCYAGTAVTLQLATGFMLTVVTIWLIPVVQHVVGWTWAFAVLAAGPLLGAVAMTRLLHAPEARLIAGWGG